MKGRRYKAKARVVQVVFTGHIGRALPLTLMQSRLSADTTVSGSPFQYRWGKLTFLVVSFVKKIINYL